MADTRLPILFDEIRAELNLTAVDASNTVLGALFDSVMSTYSRFRGKFRAVKIPLVADQSAYDISTSIGLGFIEDVLWNNTYPAEVNESDEQIETTEESQEELDYASLAIIKRMKARLEVEDITENNQEWEDSWDDAATPKRILTLDPVPTTNIWVIWRSAITAIKYPINDKDILKLGLKAKILENLGGTGILSGVGDLRFDNKNVKDKVSTAWNDFLLALRGPVGGRS